MPERTEVKLVEEVADAGDTMSLDLRRALRGFMHTMGGPEKFGEQMANLLLSGETNVTSKVTLANSMARLLGQYGEGSEQFEFATDDQAERLLKQMKALEEQASHAG